MSGHSGWYVFEFDHFSRETAVMRSNLQGRGDALPATSRPDYEIVFPAAMAPGVMAIAQPAAAFISGTTCPIQ